MKFIRDWIGSHVDRVMGGRKPSPDVIFDRAVGTIADVETLKALDRIRVPAGYFTLEEYLRTHDRADWQGIQPDIARFAAHYVETLRKIGVPMYVHCAYRLPEHQTQLKAKGRSNLSGSNAPHPRGCAVDIVHSQYHWDLTRQEWDILCHIGKKVANTLGMSFDAKRPKLRCGGDWSRPWDPAHWDLAHWRDIPPPNPDEPVRLSPRALKNAYR